MLGRYDKRQTTNVREAGTGVGKSEIGELGNASPAVPAVDVRHLYRTFRTTGKEFTALADVTFTIPPGEATAILGVNGAGKTTLSKILATWLYPTSGTVNIFGANVVTAAAHARQHIVAVFGGDRGLYPMLTAWENLSYFAAIRGAALPKPQLASILDSVGLADAAHRRVEEYSKGMKQRLHIAVGLSANAPILLLDEPTVGLDPIEAARLRGTLAELKNRGKTIILTSHNLTDVEELADRVILIHTGRIKYDLPLARFKELAGYRYRITATLQHPTTEPEFENHPNADGTVRVTRLITSDEQTRITRILEQLQPCGLVDFTISPASLEEAFTNAVHNNDGDDGGAA